MSDNTWSMTLTGTAFHDFKSDGTAQCRKNMKPGSVNLRTREAAEASVQHASLHRRGFKMCTICVKKDDEHQARLKASMEPVGEYDQACEGITGYGDAEPIIVATEAEEQADDETGHEGTVCGVQLYDPFRGLGFCDKREYHHYREGHRGNFDEILSAHAEAIEEDSQRTPAVDIDALHAEAIEEDQDVQRIVVEPKVDALHAEALMEDAARMGLTPGATFALKDRSHAYTTAEVVRVELGETGRKVVYTRRIRITADDSAQSRLQCGLNTFLSLYTPVANEPHVEPVRDGSDALNRLAQFLAN